MAFPTERACRIAGSLGAQVALIDVGFIFSGGLALSRPSCIARIPHMFSDQLGFTV